MDYANNIKPGRIALAVAGALLGFGAAQTAYAEAAAGADDVSTLETVTVTATRREEALQKVPAAVTAISGSEIQDEDLRTTKDVAKFVPGTQGWNTESRARPRFFIRGVGSNEATNNAVNPVGFYVDQVYYNNNLFIGGPLFDLQQVEVLRGPQGTLWGKNTTGGAFHFISKTPTFTDGGYTKLEIGNYGTRVVDTAYGGVINPDVLAARAAVHYETRGGLATNTTTGNPVGDFTDEAARFQLLANISPDLSALLNVHVRDLKGSQNPWYSVTKNGSADRFGYTAPIGNGSGDRDDVAYNTDLPLKVDAKGINLNLNWNLGQYTLTSITAFDDGSRWGIVDADYTPNEWPNGSGRSYTKNTVAQKSQEFRLASPKEDRFNWIGGLYYFTDTNDSFSASASLTGNSATQAYYYTQYRQDTTSKAIFGNASYAFTERFKLNGGIRYTTETVGIDLTTKSAAAIGSTYAVSGNWWEPGAVNAPLTTYYSTNGRIQNTWSNTGYDITPEYQLDENQLTYLRHASGFKSGNYNTYINPNSNLASVSQFAVVKPERLISTEVGYKSSWLDKRLVFNASAFHYDYKDMQLVVNQVFNNIFFPTLANAGQGKANGFELESVYQATNALKLRANLGYIRTRFSELIAGGVNYAGFNFARVPQLTSTLGADYRIPTDKGNLTLANDWTYTSKTNFNVTDNSDPYALQEAYWLGNVRVSFALPGDKTILGAYVNNVTDKRYKTQAQLYAGAVNGAGGHYLTGYGDPRTFGVSLTFKY